MPPKTMRLWTWHEPEFSLTSGCVEHSQSEYYKTVDDVADAYAELAKRLGTDQIIWCYVRRDEYKNLPCLTRIEWVLDVPDDEILEIVDAFIWNRILSIPTLPPTLRMQWRADALTEKRARDAYLKQKEEDYHSQPEPDGGWWSQLLIRQNRGQ